MVQMNKDERVWVCSGRTVQDCGLTVDLSEEFLPSLRYSRIAENTDSMALA